MIGYGGKCLVPPEGEAPGAKGTRKGGSSAPGATNKRRKRMESMKKQLENILHRAGEMVREGHYATVSAKEGHANYVTNCDVAVQEYLMDALHALLPSARFIAEESDGITLTEEDTFCVDPIDGTLNFIHGRRASAISVALLSRREPVLGAVYNPF